MNQQQVWNTLAESWNNFRQKPIPQLRNLNWKQGKILDIGCGNCRNLLPFKKLDCQGIDFSKNMLTQAKKFTQKHNFKVKLKQASASNLPFKSNQFDYVLSLAVLHHLKNPEPAIKEIHRVLTPGGEALITIWNKLQSRFLFQPRELPIPWKQKSQILYRYYNFIGYFRLRKMIRKNNFKILNSNFLGKNISFLIQK
jgi:ubiquinone/menaquinone biosynthesis C-methylase UbiE